MVTKKGWFKSLFISIYIIIILVSFGVYGKTMLPSPQSSSARGKIEVSSYSIEDNGGGKYTLTLVVFNYYYRSNSATLELMAAGYNVTPNGLFLEFGAYEVKTVVFTLNSWEPPLSASVSLYILYSCGHRVYRSVYNIEMVPGTIPSPEPTNTTTYVDVNVYINNSVSVYILNNATTFKTIVLGAGIALAAGLYLLNTYVNLSPRSSEWIKLVDGSYMRRKEEERRKKGIKKEIKGKFYGLSAGIIVYYLGSNSFYPTQGFQFYLGYEIAALLAAGVTFFIFRTLFSNSPDQILVQLSGALSLATIYMALYNSVLLKGAIIVLVIILILMFFTYINLNYIKEKKKFSLKIRKIRKRRYFELIDPENEKNGEEDELIEF